MRNAPSSIPRRRGSTPPLYFHTPSPISGTITSVLPSGFSSISGYSLLLFYPYPKSPPVPLNSLLPLHDGRKAFNRLDAAAGGRSPGKDDEAAHSGLLIPLHRLDRRPFPLGHHEDRKLQGFRVATSFLCQTFD